MARWLAARLPSAKTELLDGDTEVRLCSEQGSQG